MSLVKAQITLAALFELRAGDREAAGKLLAGATKAVVTPSRPIAWGSRRKPSNT
jgi:hypothetical protein